MAFKNEVLNLIEEEFPALKESKFYLFGKHVKFEDRDKMLPYLILKNTLDDNQRAILTLLDTKSDHYKLIPIFVSIGLAMRTKVKTIYPSKEWKNELFYYKNSEVKFEFYDVDSDVLYLKQSRKTITTNQNDFWVYATAFNNQSKARVNELISFLKQQKIQKDVLLSNYLEKLNFSENDLDGGVLLVTRKTKFREIVNSFKIDDKRLIDLLNIKETKWNQKKADFDYVDLSRINNPKSKPLVLVADYNDFGNISKFTEKYPHITSVVFDDASDYIQKFKSLQFDRFKTHFLSLPQFRDLYFVLEEADIESAKFFESLVSDLIPVYNWMPTFTDINDSFEPNSLKVSLANNINQVPFDTSRECFQELFCNGYIDVILPYFKEFKEFIKRWNSFYDDEDIELTVHTLLETLDNLIINNKERFTYVEIITDKIKDQLMSFQVDNLKLEQFKIELENYKNEEISKVYLMSENTSVKDQDYLIENIPDCWAEKIKFIGFDEGLIFEKDSVIFAFGSHKYFSSRILYKYVGAKIHFILDCKDLWYFRLTYFKTVKLLKNILDPQKRRELMNMAEDSDFQDEYLPFPILNNSLNELNKVCEQYDKNNFLDKKEVQALGGVSFLEFLKGEEKESSETGGYDTYNRQEIGLRIIGLDDGSSKIIEKSKYLFALDSFDEDDEFASMKDAVDKLKKKVKDLNEGDYILEFPGDKPNDLQEFIENQIEASFVLKNLNNRAESWRKALKEVYEAMGSDMSNFTNLLGKHIQRSEQTFKNWLLGYTIVPDTDYRDNQDVLKTIADIVNTDSRFKQIKFNFDENLREQMRKMKSIKVNAPKMLLKRAIYKRINLRVEIEDTDQREFIKSLSEIIEVKQIKTIQDI